MFPISDSIQTGRFPLLNWGVISLTVYVFYLQLTTPDPDAFIQSFALIPSQVNFLDSMTLLPFVTSIFLHGGFLHIISNMLFLWVFGDNVENHFGWFYYLPVYLLSGIVAGLSQYMISPTSSIPMLGASGAVAGMLGAYYVLFPHAKIKTFVLFLGFFTIVNIPATIMLGYWFILQLISGAASLEMTNTMGGVAFFAHIGGFITGAIFAMLSGKREHSYA